MWAHARIGLRLLGAVAFGIWLSGCHLLLGDFERSSEHNTACDAADTYQCRGAMLQICSNGRWQDYSDCTEAQYCDDASGRCRNCSPGEPRCSQSDYLVCDAQGMNWTLKTQCATAAYCDRAVDGCRSCIEGDGFCDGADLKICDIQANALVVRETCPSTSPCNPKAKACVHCVLGEYQCNGAQLLHCELNGQETYLKPVGAPCASADLCRLTLSLAEAAPASFDGLTCAKPTCDAGAYRCNPDNLSELQVCPQSRTKWEVIEDCPTDAHCANHVNGQCGVACNADEYSCDGAKLLHCLKDGSKYETVATCTSAALCSKEQKACAPCIVGEYKCDGASLLKCGTGQQWTNLASCVDHAHCVAHSGDKCQTPDCFPVGAYRCNHGTELQVCGSGFNWQTKDNCFSATQCVSGKSTCDPAECTSSGQKNCAGSAFQTCDPTTGKWVTVETCGSGQLCNTVSEQHCTTSCASDYFCGGAEQNELWSCKLDVATNRYTRAPTGTVCATRELCDAKTPGCIAPFCQKDEYHCDNQQIQRCNAGRTAWDNTNQLLCQPDEICTASKTSAFCAVCSVGGELQCVVNAAPGSIRTCALDRQSWSTEAVCSAGFGCVENGTNDFCAVACVPSASECLADGTSRHTCLEDGSGFGPTVSECATPTSLAGCVDGVLNGTPVDCPAERPQCRAGSCVECDASSPVSCVTTATGEAPRRCEQNSWVIDADCGGSTPYCSDGACVACSEPAHCTEPLPDCVGGTCQACQGGACLPTETCDANGHCVSL